MRLVLSSVRFLACGACLALVAALGIVLSATKQASAALEFIGDDAADLWPGEAPVRTSAWVTQASTRGVRGNRYQYQTFEVTEAFSLDKILIAYGWVGGNALNPTNTNFTKVRLLEVERTFGVALDPNNEEVVVETSLSLGNVVIPQVSFIVSELDQLGQPKEVFQQGCNPCTFYAIELGWNPSVSGELILQPRSGNLAYALEINGTHDGGGSSAINLIERQQNPYPEGRAYEFQPSPPPDGTQMGPFNSGTRSYDFPIILTAVPPPSIDGDFNDDGVVDAADYVFWRKNDGTPEQYDLWYSNFGATAEGSGSSSSLVVSAVPEPGTWLLLVAGTALHVMRRRRRLS